MQILLTIGAVLLVLAGSWLVIKALIELSNKENRNKKP